TISRSCHGDPARSLKAIRTREPSAHAFDRGRASVRAVGAVLPIADRYRKDDPRVRAAMEVVEDVGPIDGDWVVVLVHHTDHALVRRTTMSATAVRHLIGVLYTKATHHATQLLKVVPAIQAAGEAREVREAVARDHAGILDLHAA